MPSAFCSPIKAKNVNCNYVITLLVEKSMIIFSSMYCCKVDAKRVNFERLLARKAKGEGSDGMFIPTDVARRDCNHWVFTFIDSNHWVFDFFNLKRQNCEARVFLLQAALPKNAPTFQKQFSLLHQVMFLVKNEEACFLFIFIF